jgi:UDPglucose 6-dehydrogenase
MLVKLLEERIGNLSGKRIAVLGLAFKNDTDDVRDSRAIPVIENLKENGACVAAYDPKAIPNMRRIIPDIDYCDGISDALKLADACVILTDWLEFRNLEGEFDSMKTKVILEGRKILSYKGAEGICW